MADKNPSLAQGILIGLRTISELMILVSDLRRIYGDQLSEDDKFLIDSNYEMQKQKFVALMPNRKETSSAISSPKNQQRAVRNNNPLNLHVGQDWMGVMADSLKNESQRMEREFVVFSAPEWGFRAGIKVLRTYQARGNNTIRKIADNWAPAFENPQHVWIEKMSHALRADPDAGIDPFNRNEMRIFLKTAASLESTHIWPDADIEKGLDLAGGWTS